MRNDSLGGTFISGNALDALLQSARQEAYAQALMDCGPRPEALGILKPEQVAELDARAWAHYRRIAAVKYPLPEPAP